MSIKNQVIAALIAQRDLVAIRKMRDLKMAVFLLLVFFQIRVQHCPILRAVLDYCDVVHENSPFESK